MKIKATFFALNNHFPDRGIDSFEFILPALKQFNRLKLPVPIASRMTKNIVAVENGISEYDKTRLSIAESLCEKHPDEKPVIENGRYKFSEENAQEFSVKLQELLNQEITLEIKAISESDIEKMEINGTCYQTLSKYGFIKEKEEPAEKK